VLRVFKPEAEEEPFSVLRLQGSRKGGFHHNEKRISPEHKKTPPIPKGRNGRRTTQQFSDIGEVHQNIEEKENPKDSPDLH